jgi:hypothetical protein
MSLASGPVAFGSGVELARAVGKLPEAEACFARRLARFAEGTLDDAVTGCRESALLSRLRDGGGRITDALVQLVSADDFFLRSGGTP